ncbi:hypothetical protein CLCR_11040 [Cladophialophora carrionii]|uniref:Uncharacterized protein n=1 Tax=Cladophialophora carrionii TaxID=86049 RepID=A0A1C1CXB2_9EURO|nr:hypothetical protein CLCR_11040 [Cladophialophora carrionii]
MNTLDPSLSDAASLGSRKEDKKLSQTVWEVLMTVPVFRELPLPRPQLADGIRHTEYAPGDPLEPGGNHVAVAVAEANPHLGDGCKSTNQKPRRSSATPQVESSRNTSDMD